MNPNKPARSKNDRSARQDQTPRDRRPRVTIHARDLFTDEERALLDTAPAHMTAKLIRDLTL